MTLKMMELSTLNLDLLGVGSPNNFELPSFTYEDGPQQGTTSSLTNINNNDWLNDVSSPFHELDEIQEVSSPSVSEEFCMDSTQDLIDEVEEFLVHHENKQETAKIIQQQQESFDESLLTDVSLGAEDFMSTSGNGNSIILDPRIEEGVLQQQFVKEDEDMALESETKMAVDVLDALMTGNITTSSPVPPQITEIKQEVRDNIVVDYNKLTNVSEFVLEDGRNVIIMIADSPSSTSTSKTVSPVQSSSTIDLASLGSILGSNSISPSSPSMSMVSSEGRSSPSITSDDDADWSPSSSRRTSTAASSKEIPTVGRRGVAKTKRTKSAITDKKERKKWQNVEAARRYRDKKKVEQVETELEVKMLEDKNSNLKDKLKEMENEVNTLKKLMTELGLIKTSN